MALDTNLHVIQVLNSEIELLGKECQKTIINDERFSLLMGVGGIGRILAMTIHLETGDINRFANVGNYSSYCRCVETKRTSNNKVKGRGNSKNGNKYLGWAFMEAAHFAIRYHKLVQRYYQRKEARNKKIVALKAVSHKLVRACYWVMKKKESYDINRAFG